MRAGCKHYWWLTGFTHQPTLSWLLLGGWMFGRSWSPPASPHVLQTSLCSNTWDTAKLHQKAAQDILQDAIHNLIPDIVRVHTGIMIGSGCDFNNNFNNNNNPLWPLSHFVLNKLHKFKGGKDFQLECFVHRDPMCNLSGALFFAVIYFQCVAAMWKKFFWDKTVIIIRLNIYTLKIFEVFLSPEGLWAK